MIRVALVLTAALCATLLAAATPDPDPVDQQASARLVIILAVDQLSGDLFERYADVYTGGFRRMIDEGFSFSNGAHDHASTSTAVGHAALSTAVYPARNGITGNSWREMREGTWTSVYAVEDPDSPIAGVPELPGRSPANLEATSLGDWMQAQNSASKVVAVSRKDRSAITLAGKTADADVYWLVPSEARWVTSTYYRTAYSRWLDGWHRSELPKIFKDSVWASAIPGELKHLSRGDTASYEGNGVNTYFPHTYAAEVPDSVKGPTAYNSWVSGTPLVDQATISLAQEAVRALDLGQDDAPDFLGLAVSQTDIIGHGYGPFSREQMDNLLKLDRHLGEFFDFLDQYVGEGAWVLGMSADHGVLPQPEGLVEAGRPGKRTTRTEITDLVTTARRAAQDADPEGAPDAVAKAALETEWIAGAYTYDQLENGAPADSFQVFFKNSHRKDRITGFFGDFEVQVRSDPYVLTTTTAVGTSHGSVYWYDRHVPMVFLGAGVHPGSSDQKAATVDMAATLAHLAGIEAPADLDGRPLFR